MILNYLIGKGFSCTLYKYQTSFLKNISVQVPEGICVTNLVMTFQLYWSFSNSVFEILNNVTCNSSPLNRRSKKSTSLILNWNQTEKNKINIHQWQIRNDTGSLQQDGALDEIFVVRVDTCADSCIGCGPFAAQDILKYRNLFTNCLLWEWK